MKDKNAYNNSTRILAVMLTRNRPNDLARCIDTALSTLGPEDMVIVLDDSCGELSSATAMILAEAAKRTNTCLCHLQVNQLHDRIAASTGGRRAAWQSKTEQRDIAPLRNISLLISTAVRAQTTVLVDDDVCGFDLSCTHRLLAECGYVPTGLIMGASIWGVTELDTITRLSDAMRILEVKGRNTTTADLFRMIPSNDCSANEYGTVSAGYMAFRLPDDRLFAFPPGYNEDWLWCLLHKAVGDTSIVRANQAVLHEPTMLRRSSREDILFEVSGDLILDCMEERCGERPSMPESVLLDLADFAPHPSLMPSARAEVLLTQYWRLANDEHGHGLANLEDYGLSMIRDMLQWGHLEMDGKAVLRHWSSDAIAKHRSFASTLQAGVLRSTLDGALMEGRV